MNLVPDLYILKSVLSALGVLRARYNVYHLSMFGFIRARARSYDLVGGSPESLEQRATIDLK